MPPKKKRRTSGSSTPTVASNPELATPDPETWPGWCEIESEPAFFNTILHDMGVRGLRVQEVFGVDNVALAILPKPVHAVIFLFRYHKNATVPSQETSCPPHVWFANQIPEYACGTVALLNIVNNIPNLELGRTLRAFKTYTHSLDPVARGYTIDSFDFVRKIHNSFARETDMLNVDSLMQEKAAAAEKKRELEAANAARAERAAGRAAERAATADTNGVQLRINPPRKARSSQTQAEDDESSEDDGYHFVAYMPIGEEVWKLDGLDRFPTILGKISQGQDWLSVIQTTLSVQMAEYEEGQIQFSLMAVVQDPIIQARLDLAQNIHSIQALEKRLNELSQDWSKFTTPMSEQDTIFTANEDLGVTAAMITNSSIPDQVTLQLQTRCLETLLKARQQLITGQASHRAAIRDAHQAELTDAEESMHRRHDYSPFVKAWLQALADNGTLQTLVGKYDE